MACAVSVLVLGSICVVHPASTPPASTTATNHRAETVTLFHAVLMFDPCAELFRICDSMLNRWLAHCAP
jgi:hypothetical protein